MIRVTRLNGTDLWLSPLHFESVEQTPDTIVTLTNGHKYVIKESAADVAGLTAEFLRQVGLVGATSRKEDLM